MVLIVIVPDKVADLQFAIVIVPDKVANLQFAIVIVPDKVANLQFAIFSVILRKVSSHNVKFEVKLSN